MEGSSFRGFDGNVLHEQQLTLLGDGAQTVDLLGYQPYVDALSEVLAQDGLQTPFAVGVFGRWGTGKSTFMNLLRDQLSLEARRERGATGGFHTVLFQPWQFEEKEEVWKALLLSVIRYLEAVRARQTTPGTEEADRIRQTLASLALSVGKLALNKTIQTFTSDSFSLDDVLKAYAETARDNAQFINTFRKQFAEVKKDILANEGSEIPRLFIFVDDLDRCTPDNCIMVLEAIKLFFDLNECVFILGIDREVVQRGIEQKYRDSIGIHGQDYLDKLIQLPFSLPPIRGETFEGFVGAITRDFQFEPEIQALIVRAAESNPRLAKRLSNCLQLTRTVARRLQQSADRSVNDSIDELDEVKLALLLTLQVRYPVAYLWLTHNPLTRAQLAEGWLNQNEGSETAGGTTGGYRNQLVAFLRHAYADSLAEQNADGFFALWRFAESDKIGVQPFRDRDELTAYMRITGVVEEGRAEDAAKTQPPTGDRIHDSAYLGPPGAEEERGEPSVQPPPSQEDERTAMIDDERSMELLRKSEAVLLRWDRFSRQGVWKAPLVLPGVLWRAEHLLNDAEQVADNIERRLADRRGLSSNYDGKLRDRRSELRHIKPQRAYSHIAAVASVFVFVWPIAMVLLGTAAEMLIDLSRASVANMPDLAALYDRITVPDMQSVLASSDGAVEFATNFPWLFPGGPLFFWAAVLYTVFALIVWSRARRQASWYERQEARSSEPSGAAVS